MASSGIAVGFLVALVACAVILIVPNPENERVTRLQTRIWESVSRLFGPIVKEAATEPKAQVSDINVATITTKIFTPEELKAYDGSRGSPGLHLAILGKVFDVKEGEKHYAPGGSYDFFAGRDASKAFISGNFKEEGLVSDVSELTPKQMLDLKGWVDFFEDEYIYVGKVSGHFYDDEGNPTANLERAIESIKEGERLKEDERAVQRKFPPCNSEWKQATGLRVWCSTMSGGIQRDWAGVPRKLFSPGTNKWRCACINEPDLDNPLLGLYADCDPQRGASCRGDS